MKSLLLCISLASIISLPCVAAEELNESRMALAKKIIEQTQTLDAATQGFWLTFQPNLDAMAAGGIGEEAVAEVKKAAQEFITTVFGDGRFENGIAKIYSEKFTEAELTKMVELNETPLGKKIIKETQSLMSAGSELGAKLAAEEAQNFEAKIGKIIEAAAAADQE